jgi:hypothetical protein
VPMDNELEIKCQVCGKDGATLYTFLLLCPKCLSLREEVVHQRELVAVDKAKQLLFLLGEPDNVGVPASIREERSIQIIARFLLDNHF